MRAFACPVCNSFTPFESDRCDSCTTLLGFHLPTQTMLPVGDGAVTIDGRTAGERVIIGHAGGVITIDLVESLDDYREAMRVKLGDWGWIAVFFNRINTAMGRSPLYPFQIPTPVVAKLGFVHRMIGQAARTPITGTV